MKIMIAAEGPDLTARVGHRFGTSPYLIIIDTQTMAFEAVSNPAADNQPGGAGIMAVVLAIGRDVNAVLTGYCSPAAMRYLAEGGVEVLTGINATVTDAVEQYKKRDTHWVGADIGKTESKKTMIDRRSVVQALKISAHQMANLLPIFIGIILCIGLFTAFISEEFLSSIFSGNPTVDTLFGAGLGSVFTGNPINSYIIGGELLKYGVSLMAVTAFIVAWVTVGIVQMPAEIAALGKDFALLRNAVSFVMSLAIAILTVTFLNYFAG
jgi:predicted Fe-Mo cluster-binding NifX family protein